MTDDLISLALDGIRRHSRHLQYSSREVVHFVQLMHAQRPFPTEAEHEMEVAEVALVEALEKLRESRAKFAALPKERSHTA